ncbi:MAG: polyprenyl synthetase family protein [Kiritimatiellae bacterium]|nr:polyprenyl synthetase family protein [Kiritimatiellia bacterium]
MAKSSTDLSAQLDIKASLSNWTRIVDEALDHYLPKPSSAPSTLHRAMRYSIFAGGKRLRPALCLAAAETCGGPIDNAIPLACALECVHTYSLIHDDLPAMDNDDFRRGRPTCHKVFGEAMAILAGDALLTFAFELAARARSQPRYPTATMVLELARAAGSRELVGGQVADLEAEGKRITTAALKRIHQRKTAALIRCALRLGGMSVNCSPAQLQALTDFGAHVGLAFQVIDDILDVTQTSEQLGKTAGKDAAAGKATYPALVGLEKSRKIAAVLTRRAFKSLDILGKQAVLLRGLGELMLQRDR